MKKILLVSYNHFLEAYQTRGLSFGTVFLSAVFFLGPNHSETFTCGIRAFLFRAIPIQNSLFGSNSGS
jgi:hypothetical protein